MVAAGRLAEQAVKRVLPVQLVVAVGEYQDGRQVSDPPDEVTQRVKRRVVGPVNVFDNQNSRMLRPAQLRAQGGEHPVAIAAIHHGAAELCSYAAHKVAERTKGPRSRQVIAIAHKQPALCGQMGAQRLNQARLADPSLAHDQHDRAAPAARRPRGISEHRQFGVALQNLTPHTLIAGACETAAALLSRARAAYCGTSQPQLAPPAVAAPEPDHRPFVKWIAEILAQTLRPRL